MSDPRRYVMAQLLGENANKKHTELALALGVSEKTIRRWRTDLKIAQHVAAATQLHVPRLDTPIDVGAVRAMFSGDTHLPLTSYPLVQKQIELALEHDITHLLVNGDFSNADHLSVYEPKQADHSLNSEVLMLKEYVTRALQVFEKIVIALGNHDARWLRALGFKMQFSEAMAMILGDDIMGTGKVEISNLDYILAGPENNKWYVCHPKAYSRQPLVGTRRMAYKVGMNVATGHSHHFAIGMADNGRHVCVESGGVFDPDKAAYLQASTGFPVQTQGIAWIDETGRCIPWSPYWG